MTGKRRHKATYPPPLNRPGAPSEFEDGNRNYLLELHSGIASGAKARDRGNATISYELDGLNRLCEHFGIAPDRDARERFFLLALRLARSHVPYFRERAPRNNRRWTYERQAALLREVSKARNETGGEKPPGRFRRGSVKYAVNWLILNDAKYMRGYEAGSLEARHKAAAANETLQFWMNPRMPRT